jgi:hypothetical protein
LDGGRPLGYRTGYLSPHVWAFCTQLFIRNKKNKIASFNRKENSEREREEWSQILKNTFCF